MRNILIAVALLSVVCPSFAAQGSRYDNTFVVPKAKNGIADTNLMNTPISVGRAEDSTVAVLVYAGAGRLLGMCVSGGLIGKYSIAIDTNAITGISDASAADDADNLTYNLSPVVMSAGTAAGSTFLIGANVGCWYPPVPAPFATGLVLVNSAVDIITQAFYLKD